VSNVISLFARLTARGPRPGPGWWGYLGSFGDDFFGDDAD